MTDEAASMNAMNGSERFPRRKRPARQRFGLRSRTAAPGSPLESARGGAMNEAIDIARYVADMTAQLEAMSGAADLDLLAYFLSMARAEAEMFLHRTEPADEASDDADVAGP